MCGGTARSRALLIDLEQAQALHRCGDKVDQVILRDPVPKVRRQQQALITVGRHKFCAHKPYINIESPTFQRQNPPAPKSDKLLG